MTSATAQRTNRTTIVLWIIAGVVLFVVLNIIGWDLFYDVTVPFMRRMAAHPGPVLVAVAFLVGLVAFFAPCPLAMLPAYLSMCVAEGDHIPTRRKLAFGLAASVGVFAFYAIFGGVLVVGGAELAQYSAALKLAIIPIIALFGVLLLVGKSPRLAFLDRLRVRLSAQTTGHLMGHFTLYGIVYAIGAAACLLPAFLTLVFIPITTGNVGLGIATFLAYALGISTLLIAATFLALPLQRRLVTRALLSASAVKRGTGVLLILTSAYLAAFYVFTGM